MTTRERDELGAILVFFALTLIVMMAMATFAVDLGILFVERRENQSAADVGALGGALDIMDGVEQASERTAALIRTNLHNRYTDAEWGALWVGCTDPGALTFTGEVLGNATSCISFDGLATLRVVIPDQAVETAFASVVGINAFQSSATAEVDLEIDGIGGVLPFAVLGSATSGTELCLRSSTAGQATLPCTGADSGNFGALQVAQWGNPAVGTENLPCNLNKSDQLAVNISVGVDHFIRIWDGTDVVDTCSKPFGPNILPTFQGISGGLFGGMITGEMVAGTFFEGRLGKGSTTKLALKQGNNYHYVDNVPLWEYISLGKTGLVPVGCTRESFDETASNSGYEAAETQLAMCLTDYAAGFGYVELFDLDADDDDIYDIVGSPRYGVVPQFTEQSFPAGGSGNLHIARFQAVFINGLYFGCNGTDCALEVTPGAVTGQLTIPNGSSPLDQITGYLVPSGALPDQLIENGVNGKLAAYAVRLSG